MERTLGGLYEGKEYQLALQEAKDEYTLWEHNKKVARVFSKNIGIDIMNARRRARGKSRND